MIKLDFKAVQGMFFDREKVLKAVDKATFKVLNQAGRDIRTFSIKSIIYDDKPARPGRPPHGHRSRSIAVKHRKTGKFKYSKKTGKVLKHSVSLLREYIYYSYDPKPKSVVIGPIALSSTVTSDTLPALEYGGASTIISKGQKKRVTIAPHPFMRPALIQEQPKLAAMWKNSVR